MNSGYNYMRQLTHSKAHTIIMYKLNSKVIMPVEFCRYFERIHNIFTCFFLYRHYFPYINLNHFSQIVATDLWINQIWSLILGYLAAVAKTGDWNPALGVQVQQSRFTIATITALSKQVLLNQIAFKCYRLALKSGFELVTVCRQARKLPLRSFFRYFISSV